MWLNLAFQSCAVAFENINDNGCLLCPPAHSGQLSSHNAQELDHSGTGAPLCESDEIQCTSVDEINYDGGAVRVKDAQSDVPLCSSPLRAADSLETSPSALPDVNAGPFLPDGLLPLNVLHCVYLI
jgi:hypothetical protein